MKIKNFIMLAGIAGLMAACGGSSSITEPSDLNEQRVFFAFDKSDITNDARDNLLGQSLYLKNHPDVKVVVEGHCDERGTKEYNLALGQRRASASKSVIVKDGVDSSRVSTVSYGKERPWVLGTGEDVWKWNRNTTTIVK